MTFTEALQLALDHHQAGRQSEADSIYRQLVQQIPNEPTALHGVGYLAFKIGRADEGIQFLRRAIAIDPEQADLHFALAEMLYSIRCLDEAAAEMQAVIRLQPDRAEAHHHLGLIYYDMRRIAEALAACQRSIELDPKNPNAHNQLAATYLFEHHGNDAARAAQAALDLKPDHVLALENLGLALMIRGRVAEACSSCQRAMELQPDRNAAASNYLFALQYCDTDLETIASEHARWGKSIESRVRSTSSHRNSREPYRKLRVGYVSADLREHAMEYFIEAILANHDPNDFEITAYHNNFGVDSTTKRLQQYVHKWCQIHQLSDDQAADLIARDRIDILIDLSVHTSGNRLGVFVRKPAPVQMTYLGYPGTTGLSRVDYRITAPGLDLPNVSEGPEKALTLPRSYFCYHPPLKAPEVALPPVLSNGYVTFGSFNRLSKVSDRAVAGWSKILQAVPNACLQLMALGINETATREFLLTRFAANGIDVQRIILLPPSNLVDYLAAHNRVDIALDSFPYNGGTTTLQALWMGVPVITLAERRAVSRLGLNILNAIGLGELVAHSEADYIAKATALAADRNLLSELRRGMRSRLQSSPVMDSPQFTRDLESLLRQAWRRWIKT